MDEFPEGLDHELTVGGVDAFFWSAARPGELSRFKCELPRAWEKHFGAGSTHHAEKVRIHTSRSHQVQV